MRMVYDGGVRTGQISLNRCRAEVDLSREDLGMFNEKGRSRPGQTQESNLRSGKNRRSRRSRNMTVDTTV